MRYLKLIPAGLLAWAALMAQAAGEPARKEQFVEAVVRGAGRMPWQEEGFSKEEQAFRAEVEARKTELLENAFPVEAPVMIGKEAIARARRRVHTTEAGRAWAEAMRRNVRRLLDAEPGYIEAMLSPLTPGFSYGFTCPACVGRLSQEGTGHGIMDWSSAQPDVLECRECGQIYPSEAYPEDAVLQCPRMDQAFSFYRNPDQKAKPEDRSGRLAYHWVGHPMHMSFSGLLRQQRAGYLIGLLPDLAMLWQVTGEAVYAEKAAAILSRLAFCYRNWLYHDYWGGVADCDPLYAAWHAGSLPIEWKRHLCTSAYAKDSLEKASMMQSYWGAGRYHPSTDSIGTLADIALACDLVSDAPVWTDEMRSIVARDLLLEWLFGAEPYLGGPGRTKRTDNKAPRLYKAMAAVARCLGLPDFADTALRGYEAVRDQSFSWDGFSHESPSYTNMYLSSLLDVPETLHGFQWPAGYGKRSGVLNIYGTDNRLRLMYRAVIDQLRPGGHYLPLEDTNIHSRPSRYIIQKGLRHYPEHFQGALARIYPGASLDQYAVFHLPDRLLQQTDPLPLPDIFYPVWNTAILRHGNSAAAAMAAVNNSPRGGHRHRDNLALFYEYGGKTLLGDLGYVGDMPVNGWLRSTKSHNLVVVDDGEQRFRERSPRFHRMAVTPEAAFAELSSDAYEQCSEYRRRIVLLKGPAGRNVLADIFIVRGGDTHAYRLGPQLAASDSPDGQLLFQGVAMPEEAPFPEVGASLGRDDLFGIRDVRNADAPDAWQAVWSEEGAAYRLWMASPAGTIAAGNGPGQRTRHDSGRRLRFVDARRRGNDLSSVFVAVHEARMDSQAFPVAAIERLDLPVGAGPEAVALRIATDWGVYHLFSAAREKIRADDITFRGEFGLVLDRADGGRDWVALEASTLRADGMGFTDAAPAWSCGIENRDGDTFTASAPQPRGWTPCPENCRVWAALRHGGNPATGLPVSGIAENRITVTRFPLPESTHFHLPAVRRGSGK
jgi:hypothetical protein